MLLSAYIVPHPPICIPEIGKGEEKQISSTMQSYRKIAKEIKVQRPDTIILFSPHAPSYQDYIQISSGVKAAGDFGVFQAESIQMKVSYDQTFVDTLCELAAKHHLPAGIAGKQQSELDHGTMVPLYFVNQEYQEYQLVRIGVSHLCAKQQAAFGACVQAAMDQLDQRYVIIASGDLSHKLKKEGSYGFCKAGPAFDRQIVAMMKKNEFEHLLTMDETLSQKAAQCGLPSMQMLYGVLASYAYRSRFYSYDDAFGVGYAICGIAIEQDPYIALAKRTLELYIRHHEINQKIPAVLRKERRAVFVTLYKGKNLRGCIGTLFPTKQCVGAEIISNAISAGTRDPRFPPVTKAELGMLSYGVDVVGQPEQISSIKELDVKRYGIIVSDGAHQGVLLPALEGVDTVQQQLRIALQKAGIDETDAFIIERFEVIRHHEM